MAGVALEVLVMGEEVADGDLVMADMKLLGSGVVDLMKEEEVVVVVDRDLVISK